MAVLEVQDVDVFDEGSPDDSFVKFDDFDFSISYGRNRISGDFREETVVNEDDWDKDDVEALSLPKDWCLWGIFL